ncbi:CDP-alcohol phosphatidyltransferase family protein [Hellea sp.]|nr:CDP-alcohol phosphatidyltransferase family protein [Hellea sp.]
MRPNLNVQSKYTVGKRIAANTGLMVASKSTAVFLGLGSILLATKSLSASELGIILFLHAYMLFFSEVTAFQSWQSLIRYGTEDIKNNDVNRISSLLKFGIKIDAISAVFGFLISISIFFGVIYFSSFMPGLINTDLPFVVDNLKNFAVFYCSLILLRQRGVGVGVFRLFDKFHILAIHGLVMPITRFIGVIIAVHHDAGFIGFLLAWYIGSMAAYFFLPMMAILELKSRGLLMLVVRSKSPLFKARSGLWKFMIKSNIDSTLSASTTHLPALMVMGMFGSTWVAIYRIAEEAAKLLSEGFKLLDQVIYPELAKMISLGQAEKIWGLVKKTAISLLSFGLVTAFIVKVGGPDLLSMVFSVDYAMAAPLASLLILAAAITGIAAPLYPVLYATDKPERAIYARGTGVIVYITAFILLSFSIGKMAPGWASILSNITSVGFLVYLTQGTLKSVVENKQSKSNVCVNKQVNFIGGSKVKLWGMPLLKWQQRAMDKAISDNNPGVIYLQLNWILSSSLAKAFAAKNKMALISGNKIIGTNGIDRESAVEIIGKSSDVLIGTDIDGYRPEDLDDGYNKALRKTEHPYALDINKTSSSEIMRRQFSSSYKGVTDFVTKWFWPIPAFYVTRLFATLRFSPNMVTTIGLLLMFAALYYFWLGEWMLGFLTGWLMTFLDTVDGKLARTTMTYSWWGNIYDHGIDLIHPPFWYWAWFVGLGGVFTWQNLQSDYMSLTLVAILVGYVIDRIIEGIFIAKHGFHIHVWKPINSFMRFITARRNPNMFIFMIGICFLPFFPYAGRWGFYAVGIWTWLCILFNFIVLFYSMFLRKPAQSWMSK